MGGDHPIVQCFFHFFFVCIIFLENYTRELPITQKNASRHRTPLPITHISFPPTRHRNRPTEKRTLPDRTLRSQSHESIRQPSAANKRDQLPITSIYKSPPNTVQDNTQETRSYRHSSSRPHTRSSSSRPHSRSSSPPIYRLRRSPACPLINSEQQVPGTPVNKQETTRTANLVLY